jgi:hypothetical protein
MVESEAEAGALLEVLPIKIKKYNLGGRR